METSEANNRPGVLSGESYFYWYFGVYGRYQECSLISRKYEKLEESSELDGRVAEFL